MNNDYKKIIEDTGNAVVDLLLNIDKVIYGLIAIIVGIIILAITAGILIGKYFL